MPVPGRRRGATEGVGVAPTVVRARGADRGGMDCGREIGAAPASPAVQPLAAATRRAPRGRAAGLVAEASTGGRPGSGDGRVMRRGGPDRRRAGQGPGQRLLDERRRSITSRRVSRHRVDRLRGRPHRASAGRRSDAAGISPLPRLGPALDPGHGSGSCVGRWGTRPSRRRTAGDRPAATGNRAVRPRHPPGARRRGLTRVNLIAKVDYVHRPTGVPRPFRLQRPFRVRRPPTGVRRGGLHQH